MQNLRNQLNNMNEFLEHEAESDEPLSRTKRKEHVEELQKLGIELVKTSKEKLAKLNLPDNLLEAIKMAQKITSNGAIRRQYQYIGKLMRSVDEQQIRRDLEYLNGDDRAATMILHLSEKWRDELLLEDGALNRFIDRYNIPDIGELRGLIRSVRKERENNLNRNYTKLFRLIKSIVEESLRDE